MYRLFAVLVRFPLSSILTLKNDCVIFCKLVITILLVDFILITSFYSVKIGQKFEFKKSFKKNTDIGYVECVKVE